MTVFRRLAASEVPALERVALAAGALSALWTVLLLAFGGFDTSVLGMRVRSNDSFRSALLAGASLGVFAWLRRRRLGRRGVGDVLAAAFRSWWTVDRLFLTAILGVAATARFWAISFGLPHPNARPDEEAVGSIASAFYLGIFGETNFVYPPLFMLVLAGTWRLVFSLMPPTLAWMHIRPTVLARTVVAERLTARLLSAAAGTASVWLVFRIGLRLFGRSAAFTGAGFLALAFLHVRDSHFGVTDIPMTFMVLVAFLAIVKLSESGSDRDLAVASLLTGLAVATKYNAALLVLPASFAILDDPRRRPLVARFGRIVVYGLLMVATFLVVCPHAVIRHEQFIADVMFNARHLAEGHGAELGRGWSYHVTTTLRYGLGLPLFAAGLIGVALAMWREPRRGVLVASFPIAYYLLIGSGQTVFARYILPVVPFLCLTAGYAVSCAAAWLTRSIGRPAWRVAATWVMAVAVVWPSLVSVVAFDRLLAQEDSRLAARRWIEARFAPDTPIAQIGAATGYVYVEGEPGYVLSDLRAATRPAVLVVVSSPITGSPDLASAAPWLDREYELQFARMVVREDDRANIYDLQDEFYLPLAGFHRIEAPGPNVRVFVRRDISIDRR